MALLRGFLERWDDARGFGFIYHINYPKGVFIHISAFNRNISRRPVIGDMIVYELLVAANGKNKAINAQIEGVGVATKPSQTHTTVHQKRNNKTSSANLIKVILIALLTIVSLLVNKYQANSDARHSTSTAVEESITVPLAIPKVVEKSITKPLVTLLQTQYSCQGKTYCSQMSSCEEAQFYQNHCSGTQMDGDGDGIPCEDQWCGH
jgi:cold shock CspA family protein